jgi:enoyl-[acyl-carrier protein] reductase II
MEGGWMHLGADESTTGVDPDRECYPAGQGVGAINSIEPAADILHRMVEEAEAVLRGVPRYLA